MKRKIKNLPWYDFWRGNVIDTIPEKCLGNFNSGFIYLLEFNNGMKYIGKKNFYLRRTGEKLTTGFERDGHISWTRHREKERFYTESRWKDYLGSGKSYKKSDVVKKYIIWLCQTRKQLCYYEAYELFKANVLANNAYYNDNILGKFYRRDLI